MELPVKDNHPVLTLKEAARFLRLSQITVLRLANQGVIPGAKIGRQWRFAKKAVADLLKQPDLLGKVRFRR